jgi:phage terminase small subunit
VLANRGSWRAKTRPDEPQLPVANDLTPPKLPERATEVWRDVAPRLIGAGVLTVADMPAFSRYVRLYAAWEVQMQKVEEEGDRAAILALGKIDEMLRKLEQNFGLTPADRANIRVPDAPPADGKGRFFEQRG